MTPEEVLCAFVERHGDRLRYDPKQPKHWRRWFFRKEPNAPWREADALNVERLLVDTARAAGIQRVGPRRASRLGFSWGRIERLARAHPAFAVRPADHEIIEERAQRAFRTGWDGRRGCWGPDPTPEQLAAVFAKAPDRLAP